MVTTKQVENKLNEIHFKVIDNTHYKFSEELTFWINEEIFKSKNEQKEDLLAEWNKAL